MYLELGGGIDSEFADVLCFFLKSKKNTHSKMKLKLPRNHKWFSKAYKSIVSLTELIKVVDPAFSKHSKLELNKMSKILDSIGLILQNVSGVDLVISAEHEGVKNLAQELGMTD